jgi:hypothetical protein
MYIYILTKKNMFQYLQYVVICCDFFLYHEQLGKRNASLVASPSTGR